MPQKRTYRRRRRKMYRRRKKKFTVNSSTGISRAPTQYPLVRKIKTTFRYSEPSKIFALPQGTTLAFVYSANGLYDPDISGVGHQCSGFDQLMSFYNHYTVIGAKISCTFTNPNQHFVTVGIDVRDSTTPTTDVREVIESGTCTYGVLAPTGSGRDQKTFSMNINPNKFLGIGTPLSNGNVRGSAQNNPPESCYFHVFANADASAPVSMRIPTNVVIEYVAVLTEPKDVGLS